MDDSAEDSNGEKSRARPKRPQSLWEAIGVRIWQVAGVALVVGASTGMGTTWWEFYAIEEQFEPVAENPEPEIQPKEVEASSRPKAVVVNGDQHDFGTMDKNFKGAHTFLIRNDGDVPLTLEQGETTCKCTLSELENGELGPGEETEVTLEWTAKSVDINYRHSADIITNDPVRNVVRLTVKGRIIEAIRVDPFSITLSAISTEETSTASVNVYEYRHGELELGPARFSHPETAEFFEVKTEKLPPEEVERVIDAKSGYHVTVRVKPGLPLGAINQTILLPTNFEEKELQEAQIPIHGQVVSDIRVMGPRDFKSKYNDLWVGAIKSEDGAEFHLRVLAKGEHRNRVKLSVGEIDPAGVLQAEVGAGKPTSTGRAVIFPLTIRIPQGLPSVNRLGSKRTKQRPGKIVLDVDHPQVKKIEITVKFAIIGESQ